MSTASDVPVHYSDNVADMIAALMSHRCICGSQKLGGGWMPFCVDCLNKLPVSRREDMLTFHEFVESYQIARKQVRASIPTNRPRIVR